MKALPLVAVCFVGIVVAAAIIDPKVNGLKGVDVSPVQFYWDGELLIKNPESKNPTMVFFGEDNAGHDRLEMPAGNDSVAIIWPPPFSSVDNYFWIWTASAQDGQPVPLKVKFVSVTLEDSPYKKFIPTDGAFVVDKPNLDAWGKLEKIGPYRYRRADFFHPDNQIQARDAVWKKFPQTNGE